MSTPTSSPSIVIGGTIAIDHVKTPEAEAQNLLGGSAAYAALAASFFSRPVNLVGIIGHDFPKEHLAMLENHGVTLGGVERSESESFTWSGEYHTNMNDRTTHRADRLEHERRDGSLRRANHVCGIRTRRRMVRRRRSGWTDHDLGFGSRRAVADSVDSCRRSAFRRSLSARSDDRGWQS